jgi:hypothetical protein
MAKVDPAEIPASKRPRFAATAPIMISQDAARQGPMGHQVLYVLGFGLAGAIFANALHLFRLAVRVRLKTKPHSAAR